MDAATSLFLFYKHYEELSKAYIRGKNDFFRNETFRKNQNYAL